MTAARELTSSSRQSRSPGASAPVRLALGSTALLALIGIGGAAWQLVQAKPHSLAVPPPGMRYVAGGYGGFVPVNKFVLPASGKAGRGIATPSPVSAAAIAPKPVASVSPLAAARAAYRQGKYAEAEKAAATLAAVSTTLSPDPGSKPGTPGRFGAKRSITQWQTVAEAQHLSAFAAARRGDLVAARERFALAEKEAAGLPRPAPQPGDGVAAPTLAEDAAYQHAVCAMGLGDKAKAEQEFVAFMRAYPESPLVHAAIKRIARLHDGDIPKDAEDAWKQAMATAKSRDDDRERQKSLCGPACVVELLRRRGGTTTVSVSDLATEMKTDRFGSTVASVEKALKGRGFPKAQAVAMTRKGLEGQTLPIIALIAPGHFVLVESVSSDGSVMVWDPNGKGIGQPEQRTFAAPDWDKAWAGGVAIMGVSGEQQAFAGTPGSGGTGSQSEKLRERVSVRK